MNLQVFTDFHTGRVWSEDLKSFLITATLSFDDDSRTDLSPDYLLWTCRESSESRVDLSATNNLAISENPLYEGFDDPWWANTVPFLIEEQFPRLKHLLLIANHVKEADERIYSRGNFGPLAVVKATDVNFMNELKRVLQIERLAIPNIFVLDTEEFTNTEQKDAALEDPKALEIQFLYGANMSYWENVEVTLAFLVHWEKDGEALPFDGLQPVCENHRHFTFSPYPTSKMHIRWWGHEYIIPTDEDGIANGEYWGVRELFDDYETSDRAKPSQWPWNYGYDIVYTLSAMEGTTFSLERSQPNDQVSEVTLIDTITTASEQLSLREGISGGEVADLQSEEDWEIVGYLNRDQINKINGMGPKSDQETLKAYTEIEWPALYFKTFTCFSRLPLKLRRKIWFHALPEPRLVSFESYPNSEQELHVGRHPRFISLGIRDYTMTTDVTKNKEMSLNIRPFFLTCHELKDVFLEHYKSFDIHAQIPADGKCLHTSAILPTYSTVCRVSMESPPSQCYIDPKADCLKFNNLKESIEMLSGIGITLDCSALRHIAIAGHSKYGDGTLIFESTWKAIEDNFPQLKSVTLSGNYGGAAHVNIFPLVIPTLTRFHPLTGDTMGELCRQTLYQDSHGLETPNAWIANTEHMDVISTTAYVTKKSFFERTINNSTYWKGVDFTIYLWMEHTLHRAKDYIQLKPRKPIEGDQDTFYYTQAVGKFDIGSAYLKRSGGVSVIDCYADGTLFNSEEARKKGDEFHETH
ncbi:hypothetical protein BHYA_0154g00170 [Botrytis hyacinthi]|uniref:2EXR domain-containing protein n=1 Tax=Botrytis hyacinthi TaxID=278943 RepID=A0A4Z1GFR1_9HELO|nr:hypothetical protein BHYA_0154g00170 [Botrytis hyacinthi]